MLSIKPPYTIAKTWRQPKCPSTNNWFKNTCIYIYIYMYTHTHTHTHTRTNIYMIGYYSIIEKNEILPFAATWMTWRISYSVK